MKKLALIALLMTAGLAQFANSTESASETTASPFAQANAADNLLLSYWTLEPSCPEGTGWTEVGHCQPYWDFD